MNAFRAIQKRLAIELREMGTRDRVLGDVNILGPMETSKSEYTEIPESSKLNKGENEEENLKSKGKYTESSYSKLYRPQAL